MMKSQKEYVVDNPKAARFFVDPIASEHLAPFIVGEKTLAEAARDLEIGKTQMSYWIKKLLKLKLIHTLRLEKRGRHNVSVYRAVADVFIIPIELAFRPDRDIFESAIFEDVLKRSVVHFRQKSFAGRHIRFALDDGLTMLDVLPQIQKKEVTHSYGRIYLTRAQITTFHQEMDKLCASLMAASQHGAGKKYLFKLVLVEERE